MAASSRHWLCIDYLVAERHPLLHPALPVAHLVALPVAHLVALPVAHLVAHLVVLQAAHLVVFPNAQTVQCCLLELSAEAG